MKEKAPNNWREIDVSSDNQLSPVEKELTINCPNDEDVCWIHTEIPTFIKWVQSVEESDATHVRFNSKDEIVAIWAEIPKGIIKLQGSSRQSMHHSNMVSYGPNK